MKSSVVLPVASVLSLVLLLLHLTDDVLRLPGDMPTVGFFISILIAGLWLYAALMHSERRAGYAMMLFGSIASAAMPAIHINTRGSIVTGKIAEYSNGYWFVWTLLALGVLGVLTFILSVRGLAASMKKQAAA